jgi:CRP-like cAMP-binding protein
MRSGVRQIVALHLFGEMADLCSVVLPKTSWTYQALVPTTVIRIPHGDLLDLVDAYPAIAKAFWRDCIVDMAIMSEWLVGIARRPADARLAHLICELNHRYEQAEQVLSDEAFSFPITQGQLADVLGLTSIHVNRMTKSRRERGLAEISRSQISIMDRGSRTPGRVRSELLYLASEPVASAQAAEA